MPTSRHNDKSYSPTQRPASAPHDAAPSGGCVSIAPLCAAADVLRNALSTVLFGGTLVVWSRTTAQGYKPGNTMQIPLAVTRQCLDTTTVEPASTYHLHPCIRRRVTVCTIVLIRLHVRKPQCIDQI
jgi:hypothetical protein